MKRPFLLLTLRSLLVLAVVATSGTALAHREIGLGLSYDPRVPVGSLRTLVPDAALAGVQGKWEYYAIDQRLALGFDVQYHYFQQGDAVTTVAIPNGAATAPFTRYAYFFTFLPTARYFPFGGAASTVRPYVELGVGGTSATSAVLVSDLQRRDNTGGFVVQPSLGVLWALVSRESAVAVPAEASDPWTSRRPRESMFGLAASVAWALTTADVVAAKDVSYVGVQLGIYTKL